MTQQRSLALLMVALMLAVGLTPVAQGWHITPDVEDTGLLDPPDSPLHAEGGIGDVHVEVGGDPDRPLHAEAETGIIPVDRELERLQGIIHEANEGVDTTYQVIGDGLNAVDALDQVVQTPVNLYRDGAGGVAAADPADARHGGFGDVQTIGTHGWDHTPEAAFRGQEGYTSPVKADGTYPRFARALLVTPELDLRTNLIPEEQVRNTVEGAEFPPEVMDAWRDVREGLDGVRVLLGQATFPDQVRTQWDDQVEPALVGFDDTLEMAREEAEVPQEVLDEWADVRSGLDGIRAMLGEPAAPQEIRDAWDGEVESALDGFGETLDQAEVPQEVMDEWANVRSGLDGIRAMLGEPVAPGEVLDFWDTTLQPQLIALTFTLENARDDTDANAELVADTTAQVAIGQSSVLERLYWSCDLAGYPVLVMDTSEACSAYRQMMEQQDKTISFEYRMRHNLALGLDGVSVMVFTEEPSMEAAQGCIARPGPVTWSGLPTGAFEFAGAAQQNATGTHPAPVCRVVQPSGGYDAVQAMPGGIGYTSYSDWTREAIDLTPWEGRQSVWVAFYFGSGGVPNLAYFEGEDRFPVPDAGFFGFQVDDLAVEAVTAPVNLLVRPITEPGQPLVRGIPTAHPDEETRVRGGAVNLGATRVDATAVTRILHDDADRTVVPGAVAEVSASLGPGAALIVEHAFDKDLLDVGRYIAQVCTYRTGPTDMGSDDTYCDEPPRPGECSQHPLDANPCAQVTEIRFDVRALQLISPGDIRMSDYRIEPGDSATVRVPIRNDGNREEALVVEPWHVDLFTKQLSQDMLDETDRFPVTFTLAPAGQEGDERVLEWNITGLGGQHRFVALVNSVHGSKPVFDPDLDLLPGSLQPWRSSVVHDELEIDGSLNETAWLNLNDIPLGVDSVSVQVGNNDTHLLIGLKNVTADGVTLFFNDLGDADILSGNGGRGVIIQEGGALGVHFDEGWRLDSEQSTVANVSAGDAHSLAVLQDGTVFAWGAGGSGRLGTGSEGDEFSPRQVVAGQQGTHEFLEDVEQVAAGTLHSLALTSDGSVYAWGSDADGRLGDGGTVNQNSFTPVRVAAGAQDSQTDFLEDIVAVSAGDAHSLALTSGGAVYAWGAGGNGRLGNGATSSEAAPVRVSGLTEVIGIAAGTSHSLAVTSDGSVYAWGSGADGRLGNGATGQATTPVRVLSGEQGSQNFLQDAVAVAAGDSHSLALTSDGSVYAWGNGANGRLGVMDTQDRLTPVKVIDLDDVAAIAAGPAHSLAIAGDGAAYAWGAGADDRLGTGTDADQNVPLRISGVGDAEHVTAGHMHGLALTEDGLTFAWGSGADGRLGRGDTTDSTVPVQTLQEFTTFDGDLQGDRDGDEYELAIPIDDPSGLSGLAAGPGDRLGFALRLCSNIAPAETPGRPCASYPAAAPVYDGDGFHAATGDMANELRQWQTIRLGDPAVVQPGDPAVYAKVVAGPGFGVGTDPPPYFGQDFSDCPSFQGWQQAAPRGSHMDPAFRVVDKWNCSEYGDDGRTLLYKGVSPDSTCDGDDCLPYAGFPSAGTGLPRDVTQLWTPPIEIPVDAVEPTAVLAHQYSTHVEINDVFGFDPTGDDRWDPYGGTVRVNHALNASLERWDAEVGRWVDLGLVEPSRGYPTDESLGLLDTRFEPRAHFLGTRECQTGGFANLFCRTHGSLHNPPFAVRDDPELSGPGESLPAWWWPQGDQPAYRPLDRLFNVGDHFPGGSPWQTDTIPLYGTHFARHPFDTGPDPLEEEKHFSLQGETVRLRLTFDSNMLADRDPGPDKDWGWRIGGLAVVEGDGFRSDVMVESATLEVVYDPTQIGVGPGTSVPVNVTVRNVGSLDANAVEVTVLGRDQVNREDACTGTKRLESTLLAGEAQSVIVECPLGELVGDGDGPPQVAFVASVQMQGDEFRGNDQQRVRGLFDAVVSPDARIQVDASPRVAGSGDERIIDIRLQNVGNVPLEDLTITMEVLDVSNPSEPFLVALDETGTTQWTWQAAGPLAVQEATVALDDLVEGAEPTFTPEEGKTGSYRVKVRLDVDGIDPEDLSGPLAQVQVEASQILYRNDFDVSPLTDRDVVDGGLAIDDTLDVPLWTIKENNGIGGSRHLHIGDGLGEIPPNTDAVVDLPELDMGSLRGATLSFKHRYDLETGFDAGRVEMSVDGGKTWQPLLPKPTPQAGLPDGYPSLPVVGANALIADQVECFACAFTGNSGDLPRNDDGWVTAEFDLGRQPEFFRDAAIDPFALNGLASEPEPQPWNVLGEHHFSHPTWVVQEPDAEANQRYWWILNATYSEPRPLTAGAMWWSGSSGSPGTDPVHTTLEFTADPGDLGTEDRLVLSFWDWRAGWGPGDLDREGTGGAYRILGPGGERLEQSAVIVEERPDGWTLREVDLTDLVVGADPVTVGFSFRSGEAPGSPHACRPSNQNRPCQGGTGGPAVYDAQWKDNRGWFIDAVEVVHRADGEEALQARNDATNDAGINVEMADGQTAWTIVGVGDAERGGVWHLDGEGEGRTWRFAYPAGPGYPHGADSRLLTPVVDFRDYGGDTASLQFDHKYQFHGAHTRFVGNNAGLGVAVDGGAVEYQVFDEATGTYGPWQPLGAQQEAPEIGFQWSAWGRATFPNDPTRPMQVPNLDASGYPVFSRPFQDVECGVCGDPDVPDDVHETWSHSSGSWSPGGATFATSAGVIQAGGRYEPAPIAHVFSGRSEALHPDTDGWDNVEWDVSHLIGEKVRFAFHSWTNPSTSPPDWLDGSVSGARATGGSLHGWSVKNVTINGQQYLGEPVQLRFRLATDGSMPKGSWSIDDITIVGQRYEKGLVVRSDEPELLDIPGEFVSLLGDVRNVGSAARSDLALAIEATDSEGEDVPFQLIEPGLQPLGSGAALPPGVASAWGPIDKIASGDTLPLRLGLQLPEDEVRIHILVLECSNPSPGGCLQYQVVRNDRGGGLAETFWSAIGSLSTDVRLDPPFEDRPAKVVADPPVPGRIEDPDAGAAFETVTLHGAVRNHGTTTPDIEVEWSVRELKQKGCSGSAGCAQPGTREVWAGPAVPLEGASLAPEPGQAADFNASFTPSKEGVYRVFLKVVSEGTTLDETTFEFLVGEVEAYYLIDFGKQSAEEDGWAAVAPGDRALPGGSPPEMDFRQVDGRWVWGVSRQQFDDGMDYCDAEGPRTCNPPNPSRTTQVGDVYGLHGMAESRLIDMRRVVGEQATLSIAHSHRFTPGDGAVVEARPLDSQQRVPFQCVSSQGSGIEDAWFRLEPVDEVNGEAGHYPGYPYFGVSSGGPPPKYYAPHRNNPLDYGGADGDVQGNHPVIGGPGEDHGVLRFRLDAVHPACPVGFELDGAPPSSLINYTLQMRLRTGTTPGLNDQFTCTHPNNPNTMGDPPDCPDNPRDGEMGWHISNIAITAVDVDFGPSGRELSMLDGYVKRFNMEVINRGPLEETFHIGLGPEESFTADATWFSFPEPTVTLAPGEAKVVPFEVHVPTEPTAQRGRHSAVLRATSSLDANIFNEALVAIRLTDNPLPDLAIRSLEVQAADADDPVEPGKPARIFTTIANEGGQGYRDPVSLQVEAVRLDENGKELGRSTVGEAQIGELDPDEQTTLVHEWVPNVPGTYRIEAVADPDGRLLQTRTVNSKAEALVTVVPLQRPDVRVADLRFEGVDDEGYALEGSLVTIIADITNVGTTPSVNPRVLIQAGSAQLVETTLGSVAPGEHREVTALRIASSGDTTITAQVIPDVSDPLKPVLDDADELRRILRVRGIGLEMEAEPVALAPGDTVTTRIDVNNTGNAVEKVFLALDPAHAGWGMAATPNPITVGPGSEAWSIVTLKAPADALGGAYNLTVFASPQSQPDIRQAVPVPVNITSQVAAPRVTLGNATGVPGPVHLPVLIESRANIAQDLTLSVVGPDGPEEDVNITLAPGQSRSMQVLLTVPPHTAPGEVPVRILVQAADGEDIAEAHGVLEVTAWAAGSAAWSDDPIASTSNLTRRAFEMSLDVTNDGNVPFQADAVLSRLSEGVRSAPVDPVTVEPGASGRLVVSVDISPEFTELVEGHVQILMRTAPNGTGQEIAALDLPDIGTLPDLAITRVDVTPRGAVAAREPVQISVTIENRGFRETPATEVYGYINGEAVGAYSVEGLAEGASTQVNLTWAFPSSGEYIVHLAADGGGTVTELHDDNNGWTQDFAVETGDIIQWARETPVPPIWLLLAALALLGSRARRRE